MNTFSTAQPLMRKAVQALSVDLPLLLRKMGYELVTDSTRGWRIPGHGGLIIWKRDDGNWGWQLFSIGEFGDAISFLTRFHGLSRRQAIERLYSFSLSNHGANHPNKIYGPADLKTCSPRIIYPNRPLPPQPWRTSALKLVALARNNLLVDKGQKVMTWLRKRGLCMETIKKARLGWIPEDHWIHRSQWGLRQEVKENGQKKKLWIPRGLTISAFDHDGRIMRLKVRRFGDQKPRYYTFPGSCISPLILGQIGKPIIVCESELDAWLIHQQAADIITVASLGSAGAKPDMNLALHLITAKRILIALDADSAGRNASQWWIKNFAKAKHWPVPWGKDIGEAFGAQPELIRYWIRVGLKN